MQDWLRDNFLFLILVELCVVAFAVQYWWLRRMKFARLPWRMWLLAVVVLGYGWHQSEQAGMRERRRIQSVMQDFAWLYGDEMGVRGHWKLPNDVAGNDPLYLALIETEKAWEKMNPDVSDIYTLRRRPDGKNIFLVDSETDYNRNGQYDGEREQRTPVGEVYDKADEGLERAFRGEANFDFAPITDRWGTWVSAFVPLHDPAGRVEGVLGVDFDAHEFAASVANAQLRVMGLLTVVLLVLLGTGTLNAVLRAQIAERENTEESLRLLGSAVEQAKESIVITDAQLDLPGPGIIFVNPAFTQMTGYTAEEVIGKTPRILQGPNTDKTVRQRLRQTLARGESFRAETINYRKDGAEFPIEWDITPIRNARGAITHFVSIQRDITGRKQLEEKLIQSHKLESVGKLAGGVAHEFNNIMTVVIGHCELLLNDMTTQDPLYKSAQAIRKAADRAATLTRQLLAYGRRQLLRPGRLDLNQTLGHMEGMFRHLLGSNVEISLLPAADLYIVAADVGQLEQVILNMVLNAHDAMPGGGKLTLATGNVTLGEENTGPYSEFKPGNYAMLAITDTGKGMSPEVMARVFEPFFSTKEVGKGTGLGLATCYGIVKQSGGHISVASEPDQGTTFKIYLPQAPSETQVSLPADLLPSLPVGTETILLVEDDATLLEVAATFLGQLGYRVFTAHDGMDALGLLEQRGQSLVHLLCTDVVMPRLDGNELAKRLAMSHPEARVLFISGNAEHVGVHPGSTFLQKPFTLSALAYKIREVLDAGGKG
jgi:PAS domain S-box-containing protein